MTKNKEIKISKGYRLNQSTHNLIKNLQEITQSDSDTVIKNSCMLYYKLILEQNELTKTKEKNNKLKIL